MESTRHSPRFAYTVLYVREIDDAVEFYERAFGLEPRYTHESGQYVEMATGKTVLAFAEEELANSLGLEFRPSRPGVRAPGFEIGLTVSNVDSLYTRAIEAGAATVRAPRDMPWGQRVAYVRDLNGVLVVLATPPVR